MSRRLISIAGFLLAAVAAPPVSAALYLLIAPMAPEGWRLVRPPAGDYALVLIYATLAGVVPSVVFGGMTLAAMRRLIRPWPPSLAVLALGGGGAAAIYGLVSTLLRFGPLGTRSALDRAGRGVDRGLRAGVRSDRRTDLRPVRAAGRQ